jgi:hypothetical protein
VESFAGEAVMSDWRGGVIVLAGPGELRRGSNWRPVFRSSRKTSLLRGEPVHAAVKSREGERWRHANQASDTSAQRRVNGSDRCKEEVMAQDRRPSEQDVVELKEMAGKLPLKDLAKRLNRIQSATRVQACKLGFSAASGRAPRLKRSLHPLRSNAHWPSIRR